MSTPLAQATQSSGVSEALKLWALLGGTIVSGISFWMANQVRKVLHEKGGVVEKIDGIVEEMDEVKEKNGAQDLALATIEQQGEDRDRRINELERWRYNRRN